jgi:hypothetical protein
MVEQGKHAIIGVFPDRASTERAIEALQTRGFNQAQLNLLAAAPEQAAAGDVGQAPQSAQKDALDQEDAANIQPLMGGIPATVAAFIAAGVTVASGGTLAGVAIAALAAGGAAGAVGTGAAQLFNSGVDSTYEEQLRRGGLILMARLWSPDDAETARTVMRESGASSVTDHTPSD